MILRTYLNSMYYKYNTPLTDLEGKPKLLDMVVDKNRNKCKVECMFMSKMVSPRCELHVGNVKIKQM